MANPKKYKFDMQENKHLGYLVVNGKRQPLQDKIEALRRPLVPNTKKQVRALLGLVNYYCCFIYHFVTLATLIMDFTKTLALKTVQWASESQKALQRIKVIL